MLRFHFQPIRAEATKSDEHRGKRLHASGAFDLHQTKSAKKASRKEKEEVERFLTIQDQLANAETYHVLAVVVFVENNPQYLTTTGNAGSEGRMVLLVPRDGAADEVVGQALLSYELRDSMRKSCNDGRICEEGQQGVSGTQTTARAARSPQSPASIRMSTLVVSRSMCVSMSE